MANLGCRIAICSISFLTSWSLEVQINLIWTSHDLMESHGTSSLMSLHQHHSTPLALSSAKTCRRLQTLIYDFGLPNKCNAFLPPSLTFRLRKSGLIFNSCSKAANIHNCDIAAFLTIGCSLSSADQKTSKTSTISSFHFTRRMAWSFSVTRP